ncbi:IucA/IucC family protein [Actinoalloteichus fjordicus]|uniref:Siderophore synthetase component n=1 Tax=Actinoalloteichus fjordicus TaxID=1612552 RepID=A0AAC9LAP2_9PSEU|nr:IucA/IucC family protein [Actinoalloteichus fjordicus]APU14463.1 siderophore synthetase component [Actinoalloteichus fjordicus]
MTAVPTRAEIWRLASARLLAKMIGELAFEDLLRPEPFADGEWLLRLADSEYSFQAVRGAFGDWTVLPDSIRHRVTGILGDRLGMPAWDPARFLLDAASTIGVTPETAANYLAELTATLTADVALAENDVPVTALAGLGHTELEGHLVGHPWLIANKGRVGFSADDQGRYAPEARQWLRLPWLAVHRGLAEFRATPALSEHSVREHELDEETRTTFAQVLRGRGVNPDAYVWLPVHPWQLDHVVRTLWAPELAAERIIELGTAPDAYLPTQAIRTMSNVERSERFQVKLPLRILNTAVWRGIPPHCTSAAPTVTQWLRGLWDGDPEVAETGAILLGEVASVTIEHPLLSTVAGAPYTWLETLGCIWRESVDPTLRPGERAVPLAAVLHVDASGRGLVSEYIARSGLDAQAWTAALFGALLRPLLLVLYRYGITVNPHGENVLVVLDESGLPTRVAIKDLIDDVNVSVEPVPERGPEPDSHHRVLPRKPWHVLRQYLVDALLVGVFRPLARLLREQHGLAEERFWGRVRGEIEAFRDRHPELGDRMEQGSLLGPTFARYPLNGDRLVQTGYAELSYRHAIAPHGELPNPLHDVATVYPKEP